MSQDIYCEHTLTEKLINVMNTRIFNFKHWIFNSNINNNQFKQTTTTKDNLAIYITHSSLNLRYNFRVFICGINLCDLILRGKQIYVSIIFIEFTTYQWDANSYLIVLMTLFWFFMVCREHVWTWSLEQ